MSLRTLFSLFLISLTQFSVSQEVLLPLEVNYDQAVLSQDQYLRNAKSENKSIPVNLDSSKIILVDDFSYNNVRPSIDLWQDWSVYVNRTFGIEPPTFGVVTFDGLDRTGYPYNFTQPTSYGACDTLTSWPIDMGNVDLTDPDHDTIYLSFYTQPQGINLYANSPGDSIILEFASRQEVYDTTTVTDPDGNIVDTIIDTSYVFDWSQVWGKDGSELVDKSCKTAFRQQIIKIDPTYYQDGFQFRFRTYGNTSGSVDHWHLDYVLLSSDANGHRDINEVAYRFGINSRIKDYMAMPWFHYFDFPSQFNKTGKVNLAMRSTFSDPIQVGLTYRSFSESGVQTDSIKTSSGQGTQINGKSCKEEALPLDIGGTHEFIFPPSAAPKNSTTYFMLRNELSKQAGTGDDLIAQNNTMDQYQVFGTYYAYDDGTAEAGYGLKATNGRVALKFYLPEGVSDTLTSFYIYFNPVVVDRSNERFRFTVWDHNDENNVPGDIIYENRTVGNVTYPKLGVNQYQRVFLEDPFVVSDTFYIGWQKITSDVMNVGYDLNNAASKNLFINVGDEWERSSVQEGAIMLRPSFRFYEDPIVGVPEKKNSVSNLKVNLYPNPTRDMLTIDVDRGEWTAMVYSISGKQIDQLRFNDRFNHNVSDYEPGFYIIRLQETVSQQIVTKKFIVSQ